MATHLELSRLIFKCYFFFKQCVSVLRVSVFTRYLFLLGALLFL